jgi:hypothetical protein
VESVLAGGDGELLVEGDLGVAGFDLQAGGDGLQGSHPAGRDSESRGDLSEA